MNENKILTEKQIKQREYYQKNKDRINNQKKEYYNKNREYILSRNKISKKEWYKNKCNEMDNIIFNDISNKLENTL